MTLRPPERQNLHGNPHAAERDHLSHSSISTFLGCNAKYDFHYGQRLAPAVTARPLASGSAFAHALEHANPQAGYDLIAEEREALAEEYGGNPWIVIPSKQDAELEGAIVRAAAAGYLKRFGAHGQTREVELRVRIRNPAPGGRYSQTHDLVVRVDGLDLKGRVLIEDKFSGKVDANLPQRVRIDRQITIGCYAVWRATGVLVENVLFRVTKKPSIRQTQKESFEEYVARLEADYVERDDFYYHEFAARRTLDDFLRLEVELWRWSESVRQARASGVWPRNTDHCRFTGCTFLAPCAQEPGWEHQFHVREDHRFVEREQPKEAAA